MHSSHTIFSPAFHPSRTRSFRCAPMFWAVKLETPLPRVVKEVTTRLFSLTEAEYPAMVPAPKPLMTPWMIMFPTEIKLCCSVLGTAIRTMRRSRKEDQTGASAFSAGISRSRRKTFHTARIQLTPWQRKVAQATPATPIRKAVTNRISMKILAVEEAARK